MTEEQARAQVRQKSNKDVPRFIAILTGKERVPIKGKRQGFLPFETNPWDRVFISILMTVAVHLLWMRFLEEHITLTIATILTLLVTALIVARG